MAILLEVMNRWHVLLMSLIPIISLKFRWTNSPHALGNSLISSRSVLSFLMISKTSVRKM